MGNENEGAKKACGKRDVVLAAGKYIAWSTLCSLATRNRVHALYFQPGPQDLFFRLFSNLCLGFTRRGVLWDTECDQ